MATQQNMHDFSVVMKQAWLLAIQSSVVKRALKYAIVVGCILIAINHGDAILNGEVSLARLLRMALTTAVPYVVSTLSSVGAMRDRPETTSSEDPG